MPLPFQNRMKMWFFYGYNHIIRLLIRTPDILVQFLRLLEIQNIQQQNISCWHKVTPFTLYTVSSLFLNELWTFALF